MFFHPLCLWAEGMFFCCHSGYGTATKGGNLNLQVLLHLSSKDKGRCNQKKNFLLWVGKGGEFTQKTQREKIWGIGG